MSKRDFGGIGRDRTPGGRDEGIGPTGPDEDTGDSSRKGSDMAGESGQRAPLGDPNQPAEEGARIDETPSANDDSARRGHDR
jgi:hypothetical protein